MYMPAQPPFERKQKYPPVSTGDVLGMFWDGMRGYRIPFFCLGAVYIVVGVIDLFVPILYRQFFDLLTQNAPAAELVRILVFVLALHGVAWLLHRSFSLMNSTFQTGVMARLKEMSFDYLIQHSYLFFANNFTGSLVQRVNRFARAFERLADRLFFNILPLSVKVIGTAVVLYAINPLITYIVLIWVAAFLVFNFFFSRWKLKYTVERAAADSYTTAVISDSLTNHNTIQLFNGVPVESARFQDAARAQARITRFTWNLDTVVDGVQAALVICAEFFLFYYAVKYWEAGSITIGVFVLIQAYLIGLGGRLWDFSRVVRDVYESFADAKEMVEILKLPHEITDAPAAPLLSVPRGEIEFRALTFGFNSQRTVLDNINLRVAPGEKVALIGPSGAGKSTFVKLLFRLYSVAPGSIFIDGQDIAGVTQESLRANLSLVPQDPILFHRTLKENIRYGRREATDEEVLQAAALAHCDEFIAHLPHGYDTYVGERGIKLSGGERQRIAIARALLKNAPILVLDEATSSLDSHSEALIQDALEKLMEGKTTIVIAHRLSTIRKMDRIIVIDGGRIIEEGRHSDLQKKKGSLYGRLWELQAGGFLQESAES